MDQNNNNDEQYNLHKPKILVFPSEKDASKYISNIIINQIIQLPNSNIGFSPCETMIPVFQNLVDAYNKQQITFEYVKAFSTIEFVGLDEKSSQKSMYNFMHNNFFSLINIDSNNIFFPINFDFNVNQNQNYDYSQYDKTIEMVGWLDLVVLSIGENGSIGFNEPFTPYDTFTRLSQLSQSSINEFTNIFGNKYLVPNYGVTMGIQTILYSRKIVLIAFGKQKAEALYNIFFANGYFEELPVTSLIYHPDVTIITDTDGSEYIMEKRIH